MDEVSRAREVLHAMAEHLLAGPQWQRSGQIRLAVTSDGFATTHPPAPGVTSFAVRGGAVIVEPGGRTVPIGGTIRAMAEDLDVAPGPPAVYSDHAALGLDDALPEAGDISAGLGVVLAAFVDGNAALRDLDGTQTAVLWPEHFDVAITIGDVNYGVSPGDEGHTHPYAYVGPWTPRAGEYWNEPFGAARPVAELGDAAGILAFFLEGRRRAG